MISPPTPISEMKATTDNAENAPDPMSESHRKLMRRLMREITEHPSWSPEDVLYVFITCAAWAGLRVPFDELGVDSGPPEHLGYEATDGALDYLKSVITSMRSIIGYDSDEEKPDPSDGA